MGYFGRLHIVPVGVFGEENSAPQYVRNPGIYAIGVEEAITAQMPKPTTGVAKSVKPPWLSRRAHLRLRPGSSASPAPDSRSRAAVMLSMNFHRSVCRFCRLKKFWYKSVYKHLDYIRSRRSCPPTSACSIQTAREALSAPSA